MSVGGATRALVLFCNAVWNPALSWLKILLASPVSPLLWPPWLGGLPSAVIEKRHLESALAIKAPAIVHAWSATTKQTVWPFIHTATSRTLRNSSAIRLPRPRTSLSLSSPLYLAASAYNSSISIWAEFLFIFTPSFYITNLFWS